MDKQMGIVIDATGYGDDTRRVIAAIPRSVTPEERAREDADRAAGLRIWREHAESEARALGYDSLDEQLEDEYRHGPSITRQREREARERGEVADG